MHSAAFWIPEMLAELLRYCLEDRNFSTHPWHLRRGDFGRTRQEGPMRRRFRTLNNQKEKMKWRTPQFTQTSMRLRLVAVLLR